MKKIFGTGTMRTGGTLASNIMSINKNVFIFNETIYFYRHIFGKYDSLNKGSTLFKIAGDLSIRIKYRNNLIIKKEFFYKQFLKDKIKNYNELYTSIFKVFFKHFCSDISVNSDIIVGEYNNGQWRKIESFLKMDKNNKAFQVIRDPRGVLSSWKKITYGKKYKYLNCLFNWKDSYNYLNRYKKKYNKRRYLPILFENMHLSPNKSVNEICKFLKIKKNSNMIDNLKWKKILKGPLNYINISAYDDKKKYGYNAKRIDNWKKYLKDWEIAITEYLLKKPMQDLGYTQYKKINQKLINKGLKILNSDKILKKRLNNLIYYKMGTDRGMNDPSKPENWSSPKNPKKKFIKDKEYEHFKKEIKILNQLAKKIH